jgi:DNA topoisomerase-1
VKAVVYKGPFSVAVEDVPDPQIEEPNDAPVRITTTKLQREHTHCTKDGLTFEYPAKSGKQRMHVVTAAPVRTVVSALRRERPPGRRLLAYRDAGGWHEFDSTDMNKYLQELFGQEVSAKDFGTWHATVLAAVGLAVSGHAASSRTARKRTVRRVVSEVAEYLGTLRPCAAPLTSTAG